MPKKIKLKRLFAQVSPSSHLPQVMIYFIITVGFTFICSYKGYDLIRFYVKILQTTVLHDKELVRSKGSNCFSI
jgi:hypothetical protein